MTTYKTWTSELEQSSIT